MTERFSEKIINCLDDKFSTLMKSENRERRLSKKKYMMQMMERERKRKLMNFQGRDKTVKKFKKTTGHMCFKARRVVL